MATGLQLYIEQGIEPGKFMQSLLKNDLLGAVYSADAANITKLPNWVVWLNENFSICMWGSKVIYDSWIEQGGLQGIRSRQSENI